MAQKVDGEPLLCLDAGKVPPVVPISGHKPIIHPCHGEGSNQHFYHTR